MIFCATVLHYSLQENGLLVIKYFITKNLNFIDTNIFQQKVFRIMFVTIDASLKVSRRNLYFRYPKFFLMKCNVFFKGFSQRNSSSIKVILFITKKKKLSQKSLAVHFFDKIVSSLHAPYYHQQKHNFIAKYVLG